MNSAKVGPNPANPTCMCPWAASCFFGDVCHSRKTLDDVRDVNGFTPLCYRKERK
jgi:hypothetical protein